MLVILWTHALVSTHRKQNQAGVVFNLDNRGEKVYVKKTFRFTLTNECGGNGKEVARMSSFVTS